MAKVLIPLAEGCEELEAVTLIDLLRRAGITVVTASLTDQHSLTASRQVRLLADTLLDEVINEDFDMILMPGGQPGTNHLDSDVRIKTLLNRHYQQGKYVAAVCAAPMVLANTGLLNDKRATAYPGVLSHERWPAISICDEPVVVDGRVLTSRGPGTAMDFALTIIETLLDKKTRDKIETELVRA